MSTGASFTIGSEVVCTDGSVGELRRVVIDPVGRVLTHLVVEHKHRYGNGRLVPVDLVGSVSNEVHLTCSVADYEELEPAEETQFFHGGAGDLGYDDDDVLSQPYFPLVPAPMAGGVGGMGMADLRAGTQAVTHDRVPPGEIEVRRGDHVHASDGTIGQVRGFVVDPSDSHVTHVLLDEGHLWGKKRVAIPIAAVVKVNDGVRVSLTKDQVRDLPAVDTAHD